MEVQKMAYDDLLPKDDGIKKNLGFKEQGVTYVAIIGDHSGSMSENLINDDGTISEKKKCDLALSNFNEQIATLKTESDETMQFLATIIDFDNEILCQHDNVDINDVAPLEDYWTRGMTSLYDAIGYGISKVKKLMDDDPREDKAVLFIVETDGYENSSQDYRKEEGRKRLANLIKELEDTGRWTFTFLGAGLDEKFAGSMGFAAGNTVVPDGLGDTVQAYSMQAAGVKNFSDLRKRGVTRTMNFYAGDPVNDSDEEEEKEND
jgi:hypothetical protein